MSAERALELALTDVTTTRGTRNQHYKDQYLVVKDSVNRGLTVRPLTPTPLPKRL